MDRQPLHPRFGQRLHPPSPRSPWACRRARSR